MKIISFAWTTPAFKAKRKGCTRRDWDDRYAAQFKPGDLCQAWDKTPRCRGAKRIGTIRIVSIKKEPYCQVPAEDWEAEGFAYLTEIGARCQIGRPYTEWTSEELWVLWRQMNPADLCYVVRFEIVEVMEEVAA